MDQWTSELACALQAATGLTNERFADRLGVAVRTVAYWHSRTSSAPTPVSQQRLAEMLEKASDSIRQRFNESLTKIERSGGNKPAGQSVEDVMTAAAADISNDPILSDPRFDPDSIESLHNESVLVARAANTDAFNVFLTAKRIRDNAKDLAQRTRHVTDLRDLYVVVGQAGALMASTAFDLGHWNESAVLAQGAHRYAELAGHASLQAWTLGLRATLANWRNEPDAALAYFEQGLRVAPAGEPRFRLRYIAARTLALVEDADGVSDLLNEAERDRDEAANHPDSLSGDVGGEFAFGEARSAACAAAAWLDLRDGEQAVQHAQRALDAYRALPPRRRPFSQFNGALIDVATGHLHVGDVDGAQDALREVLALPPGKRNVSLSGRVEKARRVLVDIAGQAKSGEAQRLSETLADWQAANSARPLE